MACATDNGHGLSVVEQAKLENLEVVIEGGLKSFVEVGRALLEIRDGRLYRATHMTFEDYCQERWGMTSQYANRLVAAADVVDALPETIVSRPLNEAQVRPLTRLPREDRASAWSEAVEIAPNGKPTAAIVEEIVASRLPVSPRDDEEQDAARKPSKAESEPRAERDAREFQEQFVAHVNTLCDGSVYTVETISKTIGYDRGYVQWFVRMCEVYPAVKVHRSYGRKGLVQYTFEKTNCVTAHSRIRQLAQQIADDAMSGAKSHAAAKKILQLLGG